MERVTGIEPALSAWELCELMGFVLGSLRVSRPRAAWSVPWMPAVMARQWHGAGDSSRLVRTSRPVFAGFSANLLGEVGGVSRTAKHGRTAREWSPESRGTEATHKR